MSKSQIKRSQLKIDGARLQARIQQLGQVGARADGGVCRLALTDEDRQARDMVVQWMEALGLSVTIDQIGNVMGIRSGRNQGLPVTIGSHIDTVATGGKYDGALGVLAGLEVIEVLNDAALETLRPIAVGFFTNEEGVRYAPDMMGSGVHQGAMHLDEMLETKGTDNTTLGAQLAKIGYAGKTPVGCIKANCFIELHIEQGPVLEQSGVTIGAVTGVQGISWTEYEIEGISNHAGTTPMAMRHDAAYAAASITIAARRIANELGGNQVATVGVTEISPNLINVIANHARVTVDLRNMDDYSLRDAEDRIYQHVVELQKVEGVGIKSRRLARFAPVAFDPAMIEQVESCATALGLSVLKMPSGAGHDAQMFAPNCPTGMIFVPSRGGISHNVNEFSEAADIEAGANVLLNLVAARANIV